MPGCVASGTPLEAVADGGTDSPSPVAVPAPIAMAVDVTPVRLVPVKLRKYEPAGPLSPRPVKVARPVGSVATVAEPITLPPAGPEDSAAVTAAPACATGLPPASRSCTCGCCAKATPLWAVAEGWRVMVSWPAAPTIAVALKVSGEPVSPAALATVLCAPAEAPSVRRTAARPSAPVTTDGALTVPPPFAAQSTVMPATGLPAASVTSTARESVSAEPAVPVWLLPPAMAIVAAPAGFAVAENAAERLAGAPAPVTLASPACAPAVVPRVQRVPARPSELVLAVVGATVPPPAVTLNVTAWLRPDRPFASVTRTTMESARSVPTVPLCAFPLMTVMLVGTVSFGSTILSPPQADARVQQATGESRGRESEESHYGLVPMWSAPAGRQARRKDTTAVAAK